jgi:hypothetical protein
MRCVAGWMSATKRKDILAVQVVLLLHAQHVRVAMIEGNQPSAERSRT